MKAAGISDRGKVRDNNEDRSLIWHEGQLTMYAVADGMGGHAAGEVASSLALETVRRYLHTDAQVVLTAESVTLQQYLRELLGHANRAVLDEGGARPECAGMGTTFTMVLDVAGQYWLGHIGDSRAYLLRREEIVHLTEDHTLVSQLVRSGQITEEDKDGHPQRHILTRALGTDNVAEFDILPLEIVPGEAILLCTDGLYSMVTDEEIQQAVWAGGEPEETLQRLVDLANERGGRDNITVVLVHF